MAEPSYFICYSRRDAEDIALRFADQLAAGPPSIPVWLDRRKIQAGIDWDEQVVEALRSASGVLYVMTQDSVSANSECKREWTRALKYKKPIIPLLFDNKAEMPFRLEPRQSIDFVRSFDAGLARLREHLHWRGTPEGLLYTLKERLEDANRALRTEETDKSRIQDEIDQLQQQITEQQAAVSDPQVVVKRTHESIERRLELERRPAVQTEKKADTRFINRPPLIAPQHFQNRHVETQLIGDFLKDDNLRLMTVVGRGGVGKTAMVCRLLRSLEGGRLPDDGGAMTLNGIVYLSSRSGHAPNFPNLFFDLCKLLPQNIASRLDAAYKDPRESVARQMRALLAEFPDGCTIVLLDNFEDVVDGQTHEINDKELDEALLAVLEAPPHGVKFLITTRVAPQALLRFQPGLQDTLPLDDGLKSPYAEKVLVALDKTGTLGLGAPDAPLAEVREATRGFPRALEAVVGILRADRSTDLRSLLADLRLLGSKAEDVVRDLVGEAYNRLDPLAQEVMQALAVYGVPVPAVATDYLLQPFRPDIDSHKVLTRLVNMQFVRGESGRFYLHQVDRDYALSRISEGKPEDRQHDQTPFSRYGLHHRAADYFKATRKPREAWKKLDDLAPQLAEFDLRVIGQDYDAAASLLMDIDYGYLSLWGHYRQLADRYERLIGRLIDPHTELSHALALSAAHNRLGRFEEARHCAEDGLALARSLADSAREADALSSLASVYLDTGDHTRALETHRAALAIYQSVGDRMKEGYVHSEIAISLADMGQRLEAIRSYELAMALAKETGDQQQECTITYNLAVQYFEAGEVARAQELAEKARDAARLIGYQLFECGAVNLLGNLMLREGRVDAATQTIEQARVIADNANVVQMQMMTRSGLGWGYLGEGDLARAHSVAGEAATYVMPRGYAAVLTLNGVVSLRRGACEAAAQAFDKAIAEADRQLKGPARIPDAAYAKALALSGLALCRDPARARDAAAAYRDARALNAGRGKVGDELRKLDILAVADTAGTLGPVRAALAGE